MVAWRRPGIFARMTIARLSLPLLLGACTANAASPTSGSPGATLPCEPSLAGAVECSEVLRIAARPSDDDEYDRLELVLHAVQYEAEPKLEQQAFPPEQSEESSHRNPPLSSSAAAGIQRQALATRSSVQASTPALQKEVPHAIEPLVEPVTPCRGGGGGGSVGGEAEGVGRLEASDADAATDEDADVEGTLNTEASPRGGGSCAGGAISPQAATA